jgi:NADP-reducing hydrogenase subunit HndC
MFESCPSRERAGLEVLVCRGPYCGNQCGSRRLHDHLATLLDQRGLGQRVSLGWQSCFGRCSRGPNILVRPLGSAAVASYGPGVVLYNQMRLEELPEVVDQHLLAGRPCTAFMNRDPYVHRPAGVAWVP